jgi:hypothetical protein
MCFTRLPFGGHIFVALDACAVIPPPLAANFIGSHCPLCVWSRPVQVDTRSRRSHPQVCCRVIAFVAMISRSPYEQKSTPAAMPSWNR